MLVMGGVMLALVGIAGSARACSTPVNRYALYRWQRYPYRVYYAYRGTPDAADRAFNEKAISLTEDPKATSNFEYIAVNLDDSQQTDELPPMVSAALEAAQSELPRHFVVSPTGALVASGRLAADELAALVDSPARGRLASLIESGKDGVLILLEGKDAKENRRALKEVEEAIRRVGQEESAEDSVGSIQVEQIDLGNPAGDAPGSDTLGVGKLVVSASDPKEKWLVQFLRSVEELEPEDEGRPMVYAAYGRGRVMPPYIGAGIVADNLLDVVSFINGPCSCQVKDQNPGVDLLTSFDWNAAASKIANEAGQETGNEHLVDGSFFDWDINEITLGGEDSLQLAPASTTDSGPGSGSDPEKPPESPTAEEPKAETPEVVSDDPSIDATPNAIGSTFVIGLVVAAGVIVLAGLTLVLLLRRGV